jgi:hypothetical protein
MKKVTSLTLIALCCIVFIGCQPTDVTLSSENIATASREEIAKWDLTSGAMLGIRGNDPEKGNLTVTEQSDIYNVLVRQKENIAGTLNRYGTEEENNNSSDFNFLMMLTPPFDEFFALASGGDKDEWFFPFVLDSNKSCTDTKIEDQPFIWGEVALPDSYVDNNPFFPRDNDTHCTQGTYLHKEDTFGMYGVLVTDAGHGRQPEMHPVQQFWFRDKNASTNKENKYWLYFAQDASDRFPAWIGSPLHGQFLIAFKVRPSQIAIINTPLTMDISIHTKSDLVTREFTPARTDGDNGTSHSLVIDGDKVLTVNESTSFLPDNAGDDDMGIQFVELRKLEKGVIQGYVQVSLVIGDYDTDPHGLCILSLTIREPEEPVIVQ